jgi:hypothetical protein
VGQDVPPSTKAIMLFGTRVYASSRPWSSRCGPEDSETIDRSGYGAVRQFEIPRTPNALVRRLRIESRVATLLRDRYLNVGAAIRSGNVEVWPAGVRI